MRLSDEEMWNATVSCDDSYDCKFFYAVITVGVYCRPSCKSRTPLRKNVRFFETCKDAEKGGYRPCKRCRPDLANYAPALEIARQAKELMDDYFHQRERLTSEMGQLGITAGHLTVIFKQEYGIRPSQYLTQLRIGRAKKILAQTDTPIIEIAADIGFDSLPAFHNFFKKHTGTTPKKYRRKELYGEDIF